MPVFDDIILAIRHLRNEGWVVVWHVKQGCYVLSKPTHSKTMTAEEMEELNESLQVNYNKLKRNEIL